MGDNWDRFSKKWDNFWHVVGGIGLVLLMVYSIGRAGDAEFGTRYPEATYYLLQGCVCAALLILMRKKDSNGPLPKFRNLCKPDSWATATCRSRLSA